ncbi:MAG TPA: hypothetical protein VD887_00270 [Allosphingosinicella sp.]|nr:hypothetical protein [Allosphingosinicella sp.]
MGGFQDGYNGLMHPSDGNYSTWRMGGAQRAQDDHRASVTARHNAFIGQTYQAPANNHWQSGNGGGEIEISDEILGLLGWTAAAVIAIFLVVMAYNGASGLWERLGSRSTLAAETELSNEEPLMLPPFEAHVAERRRVPVSAAMAPRADDPVEEVPVTDDGPGTGDATTESGGSTDPQVLEAPAAPKLEEASDAESEPPDSVKVPDVGDHNYASPTKESVE